MAPGVPAYVAVVLLLATLAARVIYDLWQHRRIAPALQALSPQNKVWLEDLARGVGDDHVIISGHATVALRLWQEDTAQARQRLRLGCEHIERAALPEMLRAVAILRGMARSVRILPPPRPLAVAAWRLTCTRGTAALTELLRWLGTTGRERVELRLWFVKRAFVAGARVFLRAAGRAANDTHVDAPTWHPPVVVAVADMKLAQDETVATAEHILRAFTHWQQQHGRAHA